MAHVRGAPLHPQTQGKIESWHQTMKTHVLLGKYYLSGDLERQIETFVEYYDNQRYHESLNNVTPTVIYFGRDKPLCGEGRRSRSGRPKKRRLQH